MEIAAWRRWRALRDVWGMCRPSPAYAPKVPAQGVLYQVVRDHFETVRAEAARVYERDALPRFIEEEFRGFLRCGFLASGFARFHCGRCGLDRLVPSSCKGRAVCPSCGGRRMAERAAHLVDQVFPEAPVRQWVLSLPHRLRYVLAWDHALCRAVSGVFVRAVLGWYRRRAGTARAKSGRGGAVAIIQRFGAALNLNVHVHALVLDGRLCRGRRDAAVSRGDRSSRARGAEIGSSSSRSSKTRRSFDASSAISVYPPTSRPPGPRGRRRSQSGDRIRGTTRACRCPDASHPTELRDGARPRRCDQQRCVRGMSSHTVV